MTKTKWNYAVMRSVFGDLWVGKTKLPVEKNKVFDNIADAVAKGENLFLDMHPDFDIDDEDNNDTELQEQYNSIIEATEDDVEEIRKGMKKFIV